MARSYVLRALAGVLAGVAILYGGAQMYYARTQSVSSELGLSWTHSAREGAAIVTSVEAGGPGARAGLRVNDRLVAANGHPLGTRAEFDAWTRDPAPAVVTFTVRTTTGAQALVVVEPATTSFPLARTLERSLSRVLWVYPVVFLTVGIGVLMLRPGDRSAWIMAALFAGFLPLLPFPRALDALPAQVSRFVRAYRAVGLMAIPALFYLFFALFPARSPLDRRAPWLKWFALLGWPLFAVPNLETGGIARSPVWLTESLGVWATSALRITYLLGGIPLGVSALLSNVLAAPTSDARRKARVLLWGTVAGVGPIILAGLIQLVLGMGLPEWLYSAALLMGFSFPLSFAYAVVKHRVLDVPVLLRRGARYVLVRRGFFVLLALLGAAATAAFTVVFTTFFEADVPLAIAAGVGFGIVLVTTSAPLVRRTTTRIDRAFFRSAYDATAILEGLSESIAEAGSRDELATLLEGEITQALQPIGIVIYLRDADDRLHVHAARWRRALPPLEPDLPWLAELAARGRPWDHPDEEPPAFLRDSPSECLVPILGKGRRLLGVMMVGASRSEQPYSREDKRLLLSVAHQAGAALDNLALAQNIAERLAIERATARELEIARGVQFRLFPQKQPKLSTLDYAGGCVQARHVGGDYYDFVELGPERLMMVVADISGKGIGAALLMASLQANLRAQFATASEDLPRLLQAVNRLFFDSTAESQYATVVLADYDAVTRRLRYANCGHFPPMLLHADGTSELLDSTATVLGLFEQLEVQVCERVLEPGDLLVIYTDGMVEAMNRQEQEFGIPRLLDAVAANREVRADVLVKTLQSAVQTHSEGMPTDDLTVVIGRVT
jgi:sigma-B regulation protein RsbU (phosphoserine phosphatase)